MKPLKFALLEGSFTIHRLKPEASLPRQVFSSPFFAVVKTGEELSVVVPAGVILESEKNEPGWAALKIVGPLDFSETGILAGVATTLGQANISIFAISTFDTDYILLKEASLKAAKAALIEAGHKFARKAKEEEPAAPATGYTAYKELLEKQLPAIQTLLTEKIGPATLATLRGKGTIAIAVGSAYEFLPTAVRIVVPRQVFVDFCVENIDRLLPKKEEKRSQKSTPTHKATRKA